MPRNPIRNPFAPNIGAQALEDLPYSYAITTASIAAAATFNGTIQITTDADFIWCNTTFVANEHGAAVPWSDAIIRPFTLSLNDGGISHGTYNIPMHVDTICGTAKFPYLLPIPYRFAAGASVAVTIVSLDAANQWDNIFLALNGYKLFGGQ